MFAFTREDGEAGCELDEDAAEVRHVPGEFGPRRSGVGTPVDEDHLGSLADLLHAHLRTGGCQLHHALGRRHADPLSQASLRCAILRLGLMFRTLSKKLVDAFRRWIRLLVIGFGDADFRHDRSSTGWRRLRRLLAQLLAKPRQECRDFSVSLGILADEQ